MSRFTARPTRPEAELRYTRAVYRISRARIYRIYRISRISRALHSWPGPDPGPPGLIRLWIGQYYHAIDYQEATQISEFCIAHMQNDSVSSLLTIY